MARVYTSSVINASAARVWARVRDFNGLSNWHPAIAESRIENGEPADKVGCIRNFTLRDGGRIREQLLALSDTEHRSTYCIVESSVPLSRYVATVTLKSVTDGDRTFWHWECRFTTRAGEEQRLIAMVGEEIYQAGFDAVRKHLSEAA